MVGADNLTEELFSIDYEPQSRSSYLRAMMDIAVKAESLGDPDANQEEAWLLWVAGRLEMVDAFPQPLESEWQHHPKGRGVKVRRQRLGRVQFCDLHIEPGGVIPHHAHHNCNGVMRILDGELTSNNFDMVEQDVHGIVIQPSMTAWLKAGRAITLSRYRDNIHEIIAGPEGARVLDVFTVMGEDFQCRYIDQLVAREKGCDLLRGCWQEEL